MRKETTFAVIFGVTLGLILAFGIFRANKAIKQNSESSAEGSFVNTKETASETSSNSILTLLKPDNMQVFGNDIIQITGTTKAGSYVIATGGTGDYFTKSASDGSFNFEYEIDPSINYLDINSVAADNSRSNVKLEVVYSSEASKSDSSESSESEDVEDKIEEKLENVQKKAEFFKGTVTDITDMSIQMKTTNGEIKQISYSSSLTTFAKVGKTTTKIAASDVAIGDYIMALGYTKDNSVLDAFRIIVTQPETAEEVKVFYGTVSVKNKADMEIAQQNSGNIVIAIDNNSKTYKGDSATSEKVRFANISEGDTVIGTYAPDKDENIARRIYILSSQAE
jgi:hypothetical protein